MMSTNDFYDPSADKRSILICLYKTAIYKDFSQELLAGASMEKEIGFDDRELAGVQTNQDMLDWLEASVSLVLDQADPYLTTGQAMMAAYQYQRPLQFAVMTTAQSIFEKTHDLVTTYGPFGIPEDIQEKMGEEIGVDHVERIYLGEERFRANMMKFGVTEEQIDVVLPILRACEIS